MWFWFETYLRLLMTPISLLFSSFISWRSKFPSKGIQVLSSYSLVGQINIVIHLWPVAEVFTYLLTLCIHNTWTYVTYQYIHTYYIYKQIYIYIHKKIYEDPVHVKLGVAISIYIIRTQIHDRASYNFIFHIIHGTHRHCTSFFLLFHC